MNTAHRLLISFLLTIILLAPGFSFAWTSTNNKLVNITLSLTDTSSWIKMSFSNDNQTWSTPEPFATTKEGWDLTSNGGGTEDGVKCIYVKFQDVNGDWSEPISGCLVYDTTPPTGTIFISVTP
jgi:hypothetical protein